MRVTPRSTRAYTVLKSIGHASGSDADLAKTTRKSTRSLSDFTDRSGLTRRKKEGNKKRIKAVGVLGYEMRGVKRAEASSSQGLPRSVSVNSSGSISFAEDPGYRLCFLSLR